MMRLPLISLALIAAASTACNSSQSPGVPPARSERVRVHSQALEGVTLVEVPVSPEVQAAAGALATVRAFRIEGPEGDVLVSEVMPLALQAGASDPVSLAWQPGEERDFIETQTALRYLEQLAPAIEADVGTGEQYRSGYYHWWTAISPDYCNHGDFYGLVFNQARKVFTIEASGGAEC